MTRFDENHRRALSAALFSIDATLTEVQSLIDHDPSPLTPYAADLTPARRAALRADLEALRNLLIVLCKKLGVRMQSGEVPTSRVIKALLLNAELTLSEIAPQRLAGYGPLEAAQAQVIEAALDRIRQGLRSLRGHLSEGARDE